MSAPQTASAPTFAPAIENARNYTRWILDQFDGSFGKNILEVGVGHGGYAEHMPSGASYCGLDVDPANVEGARRRHPGYRFVEGDVTSDSFVEEFRRLQPDTILCCNVIEHIQDDRLAVGHMLQVLAPRGRLLLLVPAGPALYNDLDRLAGHYRRYTKSSLLRAIPSELGQVRRLEYFNLVGALGWYANKFVRHRQIESAAVTKQVEFFDRMLVPAARLADGLTRRVFGQSLVTIVEKL